MDGHELVLVCQRVIGAEQMCDGSLASKTTTESSREKAHARKIDECAACLMDSVFSDSRL
jgi:hypothetical protein